MYRAAWWVTTVWMVAMGTSVHGQELLGSASVAPEFRIDTDVYMDPSKPPVASTKTIFLADRIIDWDESSKRMLSIDRPTGVLELADFQSQRRCRIELVDLQAKMAKLQSQLTPDQKNAWASAEGPVPDASGFERLESGNLRYRFRSTVPSHPGMAAAYAQFANGSVQVSAIYPPYKPPLLRMQLNDYLAAQNRLPSEVQWFDLRTESSAPVIARVLVQETLSPQDRERVKDWDVLVTTLKLVSDAEYFQVQRLANQRPGATR